MNQRELPGSAAFQALIAHLAAHVDGGATEASCAECQRLRVEYQRDMTDRRTARMLDTVRIRRGHYRRHHSRLWHLFRDVLAGGQRCW